MNLRIGHGYDIHRLVPGRPLVLGGVKFNTDFGLDGHSDADCLTHARFDLGGKLGMLLQVFARVVLALADLVFLVRVPRAGFLDDVVLHAQFDDLALADTTGLLPTEIGLKATTNEGLGDIGRGLGIAAHAVVLLKQ